MAEQMKKSSPGLIGLAWLVVVAPAAWGLNKTAQNAMKLFTAAPPTVSAPAAVPVAPPPAR